MQIKPMNILTDKNKIFNIITEPSLFKMTYGQGCLVEEFQVEEDYSYLAILDTETIIGLFQLKPFNKVTVDAHIYILPRYQDGYKSLQAVKAGKEYLKTETDLEVILTSVPLECNYVHKFLNKTDFKICGKINNGIIYNQKKQDLILYSLQVR